tara:strand:+ start:651 stop:860 length:210 start_codon:yes stop_codon:yes gene_type:complete
MKQNNWINLKISNKPYKLEFIRGLLLENGIYSVMINQKDSSYTTFGEAKLKVKETDAKKAKKIISQNNE